MKSSRVFEALGLLYDAAAEGRDWQPALNGLCELAGGRMGALVHRDHRAVEAALVAVSAGWDSRSVERYNAYYGALDPAPAMFASQPVGRVIDTDRVFTPRRNSGCEFYNDFLVPMGVVRTAGVHLFRDTNRISLLGIQRAPDQPSFADEEIRLLEALVPHLRRALQIFGQFSALSLAGQSMAAAIEQLLIGVAVFDGDGCLIHANAAAHEILARRDGLLLGPAGRVSAQMRADSRQLQRLMHDAAEACTRRGTWSRAGGTIRVTRISEGRPYAVLVSPLPGERAFAGLSMPGRRPCVLLVVRDPDRAVPLLPDALAQHLDLTPREADLLAALVAGRSLPDYAEAAGLTINTVRFYLKRIFAKTGCRSQSELVRQALRDIAAFDLRRP